MIITPVPAGSGKGFGKLLAAVAVIAHYWYRQDLQHRYTTGAFGSGGAWRRSWGHSWWYTNG